APPVGFEPTLPPPEGGALSPELWGQCALSLTAWLEIALSRYDLEEFPLFTEVFLTAEIFEFFSS
ncbi:MAG: hypothetical protein RIR89_127, partial [Actinomycetota bacterium]